MLVTFLVTVEGNVMNALIHFSRMCDRKRADSVLGYLRKRC